MKPTASRAAASGRHRIVKSDALIASARWPGLEIVGINDIAAPEMCAYLFEYDSVFGPWRGTVALEGGADDNISAIVVKIRD